MPNLIVLPPLYERLHLGNMIAVNVVATIKLLPLLSEIMRGGKPLQAEMEVRTTFNIEITVDILSTDDERRQAYVELITNTARKIYGQAAMLAGKRAPKLSVTSVGPDGQTDYNVFEGNEFNSGE